MKVISVVGARPQLVKLAPIAAAMGRTDHQHLIVHTGQHYDADMSDVFFAGLQIPAPDIHLGIGSGSHGAQTGAMLAELDPIFDRERPDWVLVYGDTNSTVAAALAAVKLHVPVAHLEAGLRSFNRRMPEEHNRVLTDHAADLLLAPTTVAMGHLADENLAERSVLVGDVMVDVCLQVRDAVLTAGHGPTNLPHDIDVTLPYLVATLHRPDNTDDPVRLNAILDALAALPVPVSLLAHPRLVAKAAEHGIALERGSLKVGTPLGYGDMVAAVVGSVGVLTDSGGLQKEAFLLGRPCTTIRPETEWVETLEGGWNVLVPDPHHLDSGVWSATATRPAPVGERGAPYGDGVAAAAVISAMETRR
ncbi:MULTISPECIES: non-hydrolyzing UDP-N-acetylglucosamine 2-epimerase [unclassified Nocardioides]|uniref:non-hydrolyzing UDP-N-acetylglucosamine 2-epimerase n=1 Tax=unclassified Nocardioides TaxID=2615069 RepID=UPI0006FFC8FD|nr:MULTISPECIES: UDP-N-acetylglucosamine 2-epimerase (non-hydrolyzing) [unclassified Nocardioides]KRA29942.1 UDP-N-acetyl glucosamine 2-epimerase [Nocardioides sp. Root614]KRA86863.1 UDP-N-acetyl glucosamine 2-epimerase [Nocardioides sp. Root682]